jgi:hypothetical protein
MGGEEGVCYIKGGTCGDGEKDNETMGGWQLVSGDEGRRKRAKRQKVPQWQ